MLATSIDSRNKSGKDFNNTSTTLQPTVGLEADIIQLSSGGVLDLGIDCDAETKALILAAFAGQGVFPIAEQGEAA